MKNLFLFLGLLFLNSSITAQTYAVELCETINKQVFIQQLKQAQVPFTELKNEGVILIETNNISSFNIPCFVSVVRKQDKHMAFNTSTLLLKMNTFHASDLLGLLGEDALLAHDFIPNLFYVKTGLKNDAAIDELQKALSKLAIVKIAAIKQVFTLEATTNDPLYERQWSIANTGTSLQSNGTPGADMSVDSAWTLSQGDVNTKIAILDSGVDTLHEDLVNNIVTGYDGFQTDSTDTKGYPTPNYSSDGHGTACAGIAAAESNNNIGIAGIANLCKIVPIRIFYYQDYGGTAGIQATTNTDALVSGSAYAWRVANVDVMSTSAGLSPFFIGILNINTQLVTDEINTAFVEGRNGYGVPMFFSAGNDDFDDVLWPAELFTTIAVGASSMCDERKNPTDCSPETWGSSYGQSLDVVAPGVRIASTDMMGSNGYTSTSYTTTFNGTSASCPNAAGVGALILSLSPGLHARDVKAILNITADRVANYIYDSTTVHGSWNEEVGHGRVNAFEALKLALTYQTTVSIRNQKEALDINIYPNPSKGDVLLESDFKENKEAVVYNLLGEVITRFTLLPGKQKIEYPFTEGVYYLHLPSLGLTKQFVKN